MGPDRASSGESRIPVVKRSHQDVRSVIVMMAKAPVPLQVKTRLCPKLTPKQAAELSKLFIQDMVEELGEVPWGVASFALAYTPQDAAHHFSAMLPASVHMFPQSEGELGEKMAGIFDCLFEEGYGQVLIIGSDLPDLPRRVTERAMRALDQPGTDLVLGPTADGGYYLIGLKRPVPELFKDIPWSTAAVFEKTVKKTRALGLSVALVERWHDIDTYEALVHFMTRHEPKDGDASGPGRRTLEWVRRFFAKGAP